MDNRIAKAVKGQLRTLRISLVLIDVLLEYFDRFLQHLVSSLGDSFCRWLDWDRWLDSDAVVLGTIMF